MSILKDGFFWGNSTSSMQTEGGWNEGGKGLSVYDIREAGENKSDWHFANDNYHHFEEDLDLMKAMGMNFYRFQISWSRVNPQGDGEFNEEGMAYYDRLIDALLERGITPMICLYHFDMPLHLATTYNGFYSRHVMDAFVDYGKAMVDRYKGKVKYWITFNEQNLYHNPYAFVIGGATNLTPSRDGLYTIAHHVMIAHAKIANYLHETSDCLIGGMLAYHEVYPETCHPLDIRMARTLDTFMNGTLLDCFTGRGYSPMVLAQIEKYHIQYDHQAEDDEALKHLYSDYLAFSYYQSSVVSHKGVNLDQPIEQWGIQGGVMNPFLKATEWKWQIDPEGFRDVLNKIYQTYRIPVFPIENGIGVREEWDGEHMIEDDYRIDYHRRHIEAMKASVEEDGVDCIGYLGWGLIDILSSQGDMNKRYGMVYVNRTNHDLRDMKRVPKKSFYWMQKVTASNGEDLDF